MLCEHKRNTFYSVPLPCTAYLLHWIKSHLFCQFLSENSSQTDSNFPFLPLFFWNDSGKYFASSGILAEGISFTSVSLFQDRMCYRSYAMRWIHFLDKHFLPLKQWNICSRTMKMYPRMFRNLCSSLGCFWELLTLQISLQTTAKKMESEHQACLWYWVGDNLTSCLHSKTSPRLHACD